MSQLDELKQLAIEADQRGDRATAMAVMDKIESLIAQPAQPEIVPRETPMEAAMKGATGGLETIETLARGAVAEPIAGLAGIAGTLLPGEAGQGAQWVEATREAITGQPTTEEGKRELQAIGETLQPVGEVLQKGQELVGEAASRFSPVALAGKAMTELTGNPEYEQKGAALGGAIGEAAPTALMEYFGLRGLRGVRRGTRLLDNAGQPTKALRKALDKKGLVFEELTPEAQQAIPSVAKPGMLGGKAVTPTAEKALMQQIKSGARDDALAGLKVVNNQVVTDKIGKEAMRQGIRPGIVQMAKTANKSTKMKMGKMTSMMRAIKRNESLGATMRPSDISGQSVMEPVKYIRKQADTARKQLDNIAKYKLKGKPVDSNRLFDSFQNELNKLDVRLMPDPETGKLIPDFRQSVILKDTGSQRAIKNAIDLLDQAKGGDALQVHRLKKQLDNLIEFSKKQPTGLTKEGKDVLKAIRHEANQVVRDVDTSYAKVNDTLSSSLKAMESLDDATGAIDLTAAGADQALGTTLDRLLSNAQGRIKLKNALKTIDDTARQLGGKFDVNTYDLVKYSNALENRFGTFSPTSLAGREEQATRQIMREGVKGAAREKVAEVAGKGIAKVLRKNDFNAFESLKELLER